MQQLNGSPVRLASDSELNVSSHPLPLPVPAMPQPTELVVEQPARPKKRHNTGRWQAMSEAMFKGCEKVAAQVASEHGFEITDCMAALSQRQDQQNHEPNKWNAECSLAFDHLSMSRSSSYTMSEIWL